MARKVSRLIFLIFIGNQALAFERGELWKDVKSGLYSTTVQSAYDKWFKEPRRLSFPNSDKVKLQAIPTEGNDTYIGMMAQATIHGNLDQVIAVLNDIKGYLH